MTSASLPANLVFKSFLASGSPNAGGFVSFFAAGTTTPQAAFSDATGLIPLANPLTLDSLGQAVFWLKSGLTYKINVTDSTGAQLAGYPVDNIVATVTGDSSEVNYLPSGTGAVQTSVQAKLQQTVSVLDKGAVGDGSTNDTAAFQNAINEASSTGCGTTLECVPGKVYMCNTLTPKSNVTIDLRGSTIKLISGTNALFFDGTGVSGTNFQIKNGTLDMNLAGNQANLNMCGGGAWFVGWQWVRFEHMVFQNAYRDPLNFNGCFDVSGNGLQFLNCGLNTNGKFVTLIEILNGSARAKFTNIYANNIWGFGFSVSGTAGANSLMNVTTTNGSAVMTINSFTGATPAVGNTINAAGFVPGTTILSLGTFNGTSGTVNLSSSCLFATSGSTAVTVATGNTNVFDVDIENVELNNLTQGGVAIGITFTLANRCSVRNFRTLADGQLADINSSSFITMQNLYASSCNTSPIKTGDNSSGIPNNNIVIDNLQTTSTVGPYSMSLNMLQNSRLSNLVLDKAFTTSGESFYYTWNDKNNVITDAVINANAFNAASVYYKWSLERVAFNNFFVERMAGNTARISNAPSAPYQQGIQSLWTQVPNAGVININLNAWNGLGINGILSGKVMVSSYLQANQSSYQEQPFVVSNTPNANLGTLVAVDNAGLARRMTITANGTNTNGPGITLTNSTGVTLNVAWVCELVGI